MIIWDSNHFLLCLGQDDDDTNTVQSQPLPKDAFKIRQLRKARVASAQTGAAASYGSVSLQTGSASYGSGFSGEHSGSFGWLLHFFLYLCFINES